MAGTDLVDTHGHTKDNAVAEYPTADTATDASSETPVFDSSSDFVAFGSAVVMAQSTAEVAAQIANEPAGS